MANGTSANDIGTALLNTFYSVLTNGSPARGTYLCYLDGGQAYSNDDLAFLTNLSWMDSAQAPPSNMTAVQLAQAAQNFASTVNAVPQSAGAWAPSTNHIDNLFREIFLKQAVCPAIVLTAQQTTELSNAQAAVTNLHPAYVQYQSAYAAALAQLNTLQMTQNPAPPMFQITAQKAAVASAMQDWEALGGKSEYETQLATKTQLEGLGLTPVLATLAQQYDALVQNVQDASGLSFAPVLTVPPDFMTGDITWNTFSFSSQDTATDSSDTTADIGASVSGMADLFLVKADGAGTGTWTALGTTVGALTVSFEYVFVTLERTWLDTSILESNSWWFQGMTQANPKPDILFSTGALPPSGNAVWSLTPVSAIFVRNLTIALGSSDTQTTSALEGLAASASVKFLIFPIASGQADVTNQSSSHRYSISGSTITATQVQLMFLLCTLMPQEPNPDPNLLPAS